MVMEERREESEVGGLKSFDSFKGFAWEESISIPEGSLNSFSDDLLLKVQSNFSSFLKV
jgi:hypothetical protein